MCVCVCVSCKLVPSICGVYLLATFQSSSSVHRTQEGKILLDILELIDHRDTLLESDMDTLTG